MLHRLSTILALVVIATVQPRAASPDFAVLQRVRTFEGGVRIELSRHAETNIYTLLNPSRLVIDFDRTTHAGPGGSWPGEGAAFSAVRSSQFKGGITPVARVVVDLESNIVHRSFWNGRHLTVLVDRDIETDLRDALAPLAPPIFRARPLTGNLLPPRRDLVRRYKGLLRDKSGAPLTGNYLLHFSAQDWSESVYVKSFEGKFTVRLGTHRSLPERYRAAPLSVKASALPGTGWTVVPR